MFSKIGSWIYGAVALAGTITYLFLKALSLGAKADDLEEAEQALEAARERKKLDEDIDNLNSDDVVDRLRRNGWYKDD